MSRLHEHLCAIWIVAGCHSVTHPSVAPRLVTRAPASFWIHGKPVHVSKTGDESKIGSVAALPCHAEGGRRPELVAPIIDYVGSVLLDPEIATSLHYEESEADNFHVMFDLAAQTVVVDPRQERGLLVIQRRAEIIHYCVRVKEDDARIDIVLELTHINVT